MTDYPAEVVEQVARASYEKIRDCLLGQGASSAGVPPWPAVKGAFREDWLATTEAALTASPLAAVTAERDRLRKALEPLLRHSETFLSETAQFLSDTDFDCSGVMAEAHAQLVVSDFDRARAALAGAEDEKETPS